MSKEEKILKILEQNPQGITISEIAKKARMSRNTASKYVYGLVKAGKIYQRRVGVVAICYLKEYGEKIEEVLKK